MQAKSHMKKGIKFSSKLPSWRTLAVKKKRQWQKFWDALGLAGVGNQKTYLRIKNVLFWQNILSNRPVASDIEEKWANQEDVLCGGISLVYLSLAKK